MTGTCHRRDLAYEATRIAALLGIAGLAVVGCSPSDAASSSLPSSSTAMPTAVAPAGIAGPVQGQALVSALRQGGLILWMRHTARDSRSGDVSDQQAGAHDCAQQSELTPEGVSQARAVGEGMRSLGLPIAAVHTARLCRTQATAQQLDVAPVTDDARLDEATTWTDRGGDSAYQQAVAAILATPPPAGRDVVDVTSLLTIPNARPAVLAELGEGEVAVFRPHPDGGPELLVRIGRDAWPALVRAASNTPVPATPTR
ncbi:histidine phosphatase family protein [Pseudonocardia acidicola]|uniref:Histidine phosphatase family protein n=1 Tax=Pseudonocardia acidicola TaxID=2724939 RepID=A0ABX1S5J5_9PSEU|nr:histidine phosphatase family protein [Pseudonocardia acidicola]NMH96179.1 hypothetical protein [Pseudonocardia acidicola]